MQEGNIATGMNIVDVGIIVTVIVIALVTLGLILARLYRRASKEVSFVRTGLGGQKVIMNGGALVLPVVHETIPVNMNTLRLEVRRADESSLITRDRMRVDVTAEFYVRVKPTADAIAHAAQTLGMRTMNPAALKELVEGKFVDSLRAVAAEMAMEELHEKRVDFVQKVQQVVAEDLAKNGLELESVSLTGLDQTSREHFNPNNAFDAEGLVKLTEAIEIRRKIRNDIEQDTEVEVNRKNLEAERQQLDIKRDEEYARLAQQREIEIRRAAQMSEIALEQAEKNREAEQAQIEAARQVDLAKIEAERAVEEEQIKKARMVEEQQIEKNRTIETADIDRKRTVELAAQDKEIAIAGKSKDQSVAEAEADKARAEAVKAQEQVVTVRDTARAEREKAVELVEASQAAEKQAIGVTIAAEAEKQAAEDKAEAVKTLAQAEANKTEIEAQGHAEAEKLAAEAARVRYDVDSAGKEAVNNASNVLSPEQVAMQIKLALIKAMPQIIEQSVKPVEAISDIKILQVDGLHGPSNGGGSAGSANGADGGGSLPDNLVNAALRYRSQAPMVDSLLSELGLENLNPESLQNMLGTKKDET